MDKTLSIEERVKRAEEIYARRHENDYKNTATLYLNNHEKKDIKLFKKLIIQIIVCLLIYLIVYTVRNNDYIFSEDFIAKIKEILSYDTNFVELYNNTNEAFFGFLNSLEIKDKNDDGNNSQTNIETKQDEGNTQMEIKENSNTNESQSNDGNIEESKDENSRNNEETKNNESQVQQDSQNDNNVSNNDNNEKSNLAEGGSNEIGESKTYTDEELKIQKIKNTTSFIIPVCGVISSKYGPRNPTTSTVPRNHTGTDIAANLGTKIVSATPGEVIDASSQGDYGNHLKIKIGDVTMVYAHCNKLYVNKGDRVEQGQEIAEVGSTGNSTGPHLHFEIRLNEETIDPQKIVGGL